MPHLCVNIDHVATVRNARGIGEPDPLHAAVLCELGGAAGITFHLREDRRHIRDEDAHALRRIVKGILNMEMACTPEMLETALKVAPDEVTFVPERREELTTEGGLDVAGNIGALSKASAELRDAGSAVSMFIEPDKKQVEASARCGATHVEFHTGRYCELFDRDRAGAMEELGRLHAACGLAHDTGLVVNAGHGLNIRNTAPVAALPHMNELNIGHALIGRAIFMGLEAATREMVALIDRAAR